MQITLELKNDLCITGTLHSVDQYLNVKLNNIRVVNQQKYPHMLSVRNCFVRGSVVRYVQVRCARKGGRRRLLPCMQAVPAAQYEQQRPDRPCLPAPCLVKGGGPGEHRHWSGGECRNAAASHAPYGKGAT